MNRKKYVVILCLSKSYVKISNHFQFLTAAYLLRSMLTSLISGSTSTNMMSHHHVFCSGIQKDTKESISLVMLSYNCSTLNHVLLVH